MNFGIGSARAWLHSWGAAGSAEPGPDGGQTGLGDARPYVLGGLAVCFLLIGGLGVWGGTAKIAGAVIAQGSVVVDSNVKKVQHPTGGIVGEIHVRDGDRVAAGDLLLKLDETLTRANLAVLSRQLDELQGRAARLKAERDGRVTLDVPKDFLGREDEPQVFEIIAGERLLLTSRRESRDGQKAQLRERIAQLREEIEGLTRQKQSKDREIELIGNELRALVPLEEQKLVTSQKMMSLRREATRLDGEQAGLQASIAQGRGRIGEIEINILNLEQDARTEIVKELREIQAKEAELVERRVAAQDQLRRVEIRAPQAGIVHQSAVHTIGGVINPGEALMMIVPQGDKLAIEARVAPNDIDQARSATRALLRFTALNTRTTPELVGKVQRISADLTQDAKSGLSFYVARIEIEDEELSRLGGVTLVPGMPVDVQIKTSERTALSYLLKPFEDQLARAFRER